VGLTSLAFVVVVVVEEGKQETRGEAAFGTVARVACFLPQMDIDPLSTFLPFLLDNSPSVL
jgi:hypothetical protein